MNLARALTRILAATVLLSVVAVGAVLGLAALRERAPGPPSAVGGPTTPIPTTAATPQPSAVPTTGPLVPWHVYYARTGLPPADGTVMVAGVPSDRVEGRILQRLGALEHGVRPGDVPAGASNPLAQIRGVLQTTSAGTTQSSLSQSVRVDGDLATVEFELGDWGVRTLDGARALVQQLVYTITDEPSIRRAWVLEKGKDHALILAGGTGSGYTWKDPLTREDVFGYTHKGASGKPFVAAGEQGGALTLSTAYSVDQVAPGLLRFVINVEGLPRQHYPDFSISAYTNTQMPNAKAELEITIPGAGDATTQAATVDRTPLRSIAVGSPVTFRARVYRLGLDDLRPWRAVVLFDPTRIVVDVGGPPSGISSDDETVVYSPLANASVGRAFKLAGVVRAFEATFAWRVRDAAGAVVVRGVGKANIGTSPVWGGYELDVTLPATASGLLSLEVYQSSARDGSESSLVKVPLRVGP